MCRVCEPFSASVEHLASGIALAALRDTRCRLGARLKYEFSHKSRPIAMNRDRVSCDDGKCSASRLEDGTRLTTLFVTYLHYA